MQQGFIFDIQGLSVHDGPGCRTLIFLRACSLHCFWCSNPEGISTTPTPLYFKSKCLLDGKCLEACPHEACQISDNQLHISREVCQTCTTYECAKACLTEAICISGYKISIQDLMKTIQRDRKFWGSLGGVTLTGGEPLLQIDFASELLKSCYEAYIHTAIETCGNVPWSHFEKAMPYLDWIFFDLKHMNSEVHKKACGADNDRILKNAERLAGEFPNRLIFRLPLIPGFNDGSENIKAMARFIKDIGKNEINLLPLHHLGREKYQMINQSYTASDYKIPTKSDLERIKEQFTSQGVDCYLNDETPF